MTSIREYPFEQSENKVEDAPDTPATVGELPTFPAKGEVPRRVSILSQEKNKNREDVSERSGRVSIVDAPTRRKSNMLHHAMAKNDEQAPWERKKSVPSKENQPERSGRHSVVEAPTRRKSNMLHHALATNEQDAPWDRRTSKDNQRKVSTPYISGRVSVAAEGPTRRKSNMLHSAFATNDSGAPWERSQTEGQFKKNSNASTVYSKKLNNQEQAEKISIVTNEGERKRPWWYGFCLNCHQPDEGEPSWEPPHWQKICPYPLCPSYRHFAQTLTLFIIGILLWVTVWTVLGDTAAPGGQLFMLVVLSLAAYFGGWLFSIITTLPPLIGMLFMGILMKNVDFVDFDSDYLKVCSYIRKIALTIILTRAGLDLDPIALKKYFFTVIRLALLPWVFECILCGTLTHYLLGLPWLWAFLLGSVIAAVSPAVIVPCLFRLRDKGYGVAKGIPTLVLAVAGADDAASVAVFGVISALMFSEKSITVNVVQGVLSVFGGILIGALCGWFIKFIPEKNDPFAVPLRVLLMLTAGLFLVIFSEEIEMEGAGPLAVIAFGFFAGKSWSDQGWEIEENPVATSFEIFWMIIEPILFGTTGAQVVIDELDSTLVLYAAGILLTCFFLRVVVTFVCAFGSSLNFKEKLFVGLAWMAKATVQAALGSIALDQLTKIYGDEVPEELEGYANTVLTMCVLSIVIAAPLGAIVISITGPMLLTVVNSPPSVSEGWKSTRASLKECSIVDEDELREREKESKMAMDLANNRNNAQQVEAV